MAVPVVAAFAIPALVIPYAGMLSVLALALPMSTAGDYARQGAERRLEAHRKGCDLAPAEFSCTTVTREGATVVTGLLVGASLSHIAVYDPTEHRALTIERGGLVLSVKHRSVQAVGPN